MTITIIPQTNQEAFDMAVSHMAGMKERAWGPLPSVTDLPKEGCVYRGPEGQRCAFGALISDDQYDHAIENIGVHMLVKSGRVSLGAVALGLVDRLQGVHDMESSWCGGGLDHIAWRDILGIAAEFSLDTAKVPVLV